MSVFVDTSAVLAISDGDDENHDWAGRTWKSLLEDTLTLSTTNYVVVETISVMHRRFGIPAVRRFCEELLPALGVIWVDQESHDRGVRSVIGGGRRGPSLVDHVSFNTIAEHQIAQVFAYDQHFTEQGYELCGQPE